MYNSNDSEPKNQSNPQAVLIEKAFAFTPADLRENRQGKLTPSQASHLRKIAQRLALVIVAVIGGLAILTVISAQPNSSDLMPLLLCLGLPAIFTLAITVGATEFAVLPSVVAKRSGMVHLSYGMMSYDPPLDYTQPRNMLRFGMGGHGAYRMMVGNAEFRLTRDQYDAIPAGAYMDVYFLPTIRKIVSLEVVKHKIEEDNIPDIDLPDDDLLIATPDLPNRLSAPSYDDDQDQIKG